MTWLNLTPHVILILRDGAEDITLPSCGVARAAAETELIGTVDGIRITRSTFGKPVNLPDFQEGVGLVVSLATVNAARQYGRRTDDLYIVNETVRDASGQIVGCRSLAQVD